MKCQSPKLQVIIRESQKFPGLRAPYWVRRMHGGVAVDFGSQPYLNTQISRLLPSMERPIPIENSCCLWISTSFLSSFNFMFTDTKKHYHCQVFHADWNSPMLPSSGAATLCVSWIPLCSEIGHFLFTTSPGLVRPVCFKSGHNIILTGLPLNSSLTYSTQFSNRLLSLQTLKFAKLLHFLHDVIQNLTSSAAWPRLSPLKSTEAQNWHQETWKPNGYFSYLAKIKIKPTASLGNPRSVFSESSW